MKIAVITGASSGMGMEFAKQICTKCLGLDEIWLIARREERLKKLAEELALPARIFKMDLTDDTAYGELTEALEKEQPQVRIAVNCAGFGKTAPFVDIGQEETLGMIDLNCRALTKMTCLLLPYMKPRSYLIQLASIAGILPQPNFAVYAASKAYVLSLSRALRQELRPRGIRVTAVCPGPVDTEFFTIAEETGAAFPIKKFFMAGKEKVVAKALRDTIKGKDMSVYGVSMNLLRLAVKIVPQKWAVSVYAGLCRRVSQKYKNNKERYHVSKIQPEGRRISKTQKKTGNC